MDKVISYAVVGWFWASLLAGQAFMIGIAAVVFVGYFRRPLFPPSKNRK